MKVTFETPVHKDVVIAKFEDGTLCRLNMIFKEVKKDICTTAMEFSHFETSDMLPAGIEKEKIFEMALNARKSALQKDNERNEEIYLSEAKEQLSPAFL